MKTQKHLPRWQPEGMRLETAYVGNGVLLYTCNAVNCHYPLGSCWVLLTSNDFGEAICEIVDIYVPEKCRRRGIARYMLAYLLDAYGILRTGTGTKRYGMPMMRAMGFRQNKQTGDWYLRGTPKLLTTSAANRRAAACNRC